MEVRLTPRTWPIWATVSARSSLSVRAVRRCSAPSLERRPPDRPRARAAASPAIVAACPDNRELGQRPEQVEHQPTSRGSGVDRLAQRPAVSYTHLRAHETVLD